MTTKRCGWLGLVVALVLAGWVPGGATPAQGADLGKYISPEFCGALVIHPDRISKSTLAQAAKAGLPKEMATADPVKSALEAIKNKPDLPKGMDVAKLAKLLEGKTVRRLVFLIDPLPVPKVPAAPGIIVQFSEDIDGEALVAAISTAWEPADCNGVKYHKLKGLAPGEPDAALVVPDARTLIVGLDVTVKKMLAKDQGSQPLLAQLQRASFDNDILVEFLADPLLEKVTKTTGMTPDQAFAALGNPMLANLAKEIKSASLKLNFSGKQLLHAEIGTVKPETASMLAMVAQQSIAAAKPQFEAMMKNPPPMIPPPLAPTLTTLGGEVFDGLKAKSSGTRMELDLAMPPSLPEALKSLAEMGAQMQGAK